MMPLTVHCLLFIRGENAFAIPMCVDVGVPRRRSLSDLLGFQASDIPVCPADRAEKEKSLKNRPFFSSLALVPGHNALIPKNLLE